jgi:hypothetical protein
MNAYLESVGVDGVKGDVKGSRGENRRVLKWRENGEVCFVVSLLNKNVCLCGISNASKCFEEPVSA